MPTSIFSIGILLIQGVKTVQEDTIQMLQYKSYEAIEAGSINPDENY